MGIRRVNFPLCALERLAENCFVSRKASFSQINVNTQYRRSMSLIPFAYRRVMPCSSLQASQHWSIPHCEIPLRFQERGLPVCGTQLFANQCNPIVNRPILFYCRSMSLIPFANRWIVWCSSPKPHNIRLFPIVKFLFVFENEVLRNQPSESM